MQQKQNIKVALIGNPNTGKTSVFNQLTGLNQQVGNYPGITVEKNKAFVTFHPALKQKFSIYPELIVSTPVQ